MFSKFAFLIFLFIFMSSVVVAMVQRMERGTTALKNAILKMEEQLQRTCIVGFGCDPLFQKDCGVNVWTIR